MGWLRRLLGREDPEGDLLPALPAPVLPTVQRPPSCPFCGTRLAGTAAGLEAIAALQPCRCGNQPIALRGAARRPLSRRDAYAVYIASAEWRSKREAFRRYWVRSHGVWACAVCGTTVNRHTHHITYERLGNEAMEDLLPVCQLHLHQVHRQERRALGRGA